MHETIKITMATIVGLISMTVRELSKTFLVIFCTNLFLACNKLGSLHNIENLWSTQKPKANFIHTNLFNVLFDIVLGLL
jgi:hypothetical protein